MSLVPYKKYGKYTRAFYPARTYYKSYGRGKYTKASSKISRIARDVSMLKKIIEIKQIDYRPDPLADFVLPYNASNTAAMYLINNVVSGTASNQRIGRKINMKSLEIFFIAQWVYSAEKASTPEFLPSNSLRCAVIYDNQPMTWGNAGSFPDKSTIFGTFGNIGNTSNVFSPINPASTQRFTLLADHHVHTDPQVNPNDLDPSATAPGLPQASQHFEWRRKITLKDLPATYLDSGSGISSVMGGALYVLIYSTIQSIQSIGHQYDNHFVLGASTNFRLRYVDTQ